MLLVAAAILRFCFFTTRLSPIVLYPSAFAHFCRPGFHGESKEVLSPKRTAAVYNGHTGAVYLSCISCVLLYSTHPPRLLYCSLSTPSYALCCSKPSKGQKLDPSLPRFVCRPYSATASMLVVSHVPVILPCPGPIPPPICFLAQHTAQIM